MEKVIILNPNAGSADATIYQTAEKLNLPIMLSRYEGHLSKLLLEQSKRGPTFFLVAGGDGTLNEACNALMKIEKKKRHTHTLAQIPLGTANDFARSSGWLAPSADHKYVSKILSTPPKTIDLIKIDRNELPSHYGINVCAGGFVPQMNRTMNNSLKSILGQASYALGSARTMIGRQSYEANLSFDNIAYGETLNIWNVIVGKGQYAGGGAKVAPKGCLDDGKLHVYIFRDKGLISSTVDGALSYWGWHKYSSRIIYQAVENFAIHTEPAIPCSSDGELLSGSVKCFSIEAKALQFVCGDQAETRLAA